MGGITLKHVLVFSIKALLVAVAYLVSVMGVGMIWGMLGFALPDNTATQNPLIGIAISSLVMGVTFGIFATQVNVTRIQHFGIWFALLFFNITSVMIEGLFFAPELVSALPLLILQQAVGALMVAIVVTFLFAHRTAPIRYSSPHRTATNWLMRFGVAGVIYLLCYWVFGALNFTFVTHTYYESNPNLAIPPTQTVLLAELVRAPMIIFSLVPLLLAWHAPRLQLMLVSGMLLFLIGGVVPLLWQASALPAFLLIASGWEIFAQNMVTGMVCAWLVGMPSDKTVGSATLAHSH